MELVKKHFTLYELKSFVKTFIAELSFDAGIGVAFGVVVGGDWSKGALLTLGILIGRALWRSVIKLLWSGAGAVLTKKPQV